MSATSRSSSGDVFRDLGFSSAESEDLRLRSDLMIELKSQILARRKSQAEIARLLGINQPRVSNLLSGRIDKFSLDSLVEMLDRLGSRVEMTVQDRECDIHEETGATISYSIDAIWAAVSADVQASLQKATDDANRTLAAADNQYAMAA